MKDNVWGGNENKILKVREKVNVSQNAFRGS